MQEELSKALRTMSDPRLSDVIVSRVEVTDDLQLARVFIRLARRGDEPGPRKGALKALDTAKVRLRRSVAMALSLRYAPDLRFGYDEAPDATERVEELLREIKTEDSQRKT
jgi:ribosome-binding factor A